MFGWDYGYYNNKGQLNICRDIKHVTIKIVFSFPFFFTVKLNSNRTSVN